MTTPRVLFGARYRHSQERGKEVVLELGGLEFTRPVTSEVEAHMLWAEIRGRLQLAGFHFEEEGGDT